MHRVSSFIMQLFGWKVDILFSTQTLDKFIIIVLPHTSNWDFPIGVLTRSMLRRRVVFLAKSGLFRFPFGFFFRWLGGYPVERGRSTNFVDSVVTIFNKKEKFAVCISPEGTRKKVEKLKTGFYYIAKGANIPIIFCKFDWGNKHVEFRAPFYTTDDQAADFAVLEDYFRGVEGRNPKAGYLYAKK